MRRIVSNTGPLLHLSEARALDLLNLAGEVHIPSGVETKVAYHISAWSTPAWMAVDTLAESHAADAIAWQQAGLLHRGEAETIALARQLDADWLLTDDTAARLVAQKLGLEVHGSLGIPPIQKPRALRASRPWAYDHGECQANQQAVGDRPAARDLPSASHLDIFYLDATP